MGLKGRPIEDLTYALRLAASFAGGACAMRFVAVDEPLWAVLVLWALVHAWLVAS